MSGTQVQWRGGTSAEHAAFTGAAREVTVDTAKKTLVVHDGVTAGGLPLAREDLSNVAAATGRAALSVYAKSEIDARQPSFRNLLLNGDMLVAQRFAGVSVLGNSMTYGTLDRWAGMAASGSTSVMGQIAAAGLPGLAKALVLGRGAGSTATGQVSVAQALESVNSVPAAGKAVTLSFWAKAGANFSAASGQMFAYACSGTGTDQPVASISGGWSGQTYPVGGTAALASAWQRFIYTGTIPTNATQLGVEFYYTPVGTAGADDNAYITGVQLEIGTAATAFEVLPYDVQLARCQRYARLLPKLQAVCNYSNGTISAYLLPTGILASLRATPTVAKDVGGTTTMALTNGSGAVSFASLTPNMADCQTFSNFVVGAPGSALTVGQSYTLSNLLLNAEL